MRAGHGREGDLAPGVEAAFVNACAPNTRLDNPAAPLRLGYTAAAPLVCVPTSSPHVSGRGPPRWRPADARGVPRRGRVPRDDGSAEGDRHTLQAGFLELSENAKSCRFSPTFSSNSSCASAFAAQAYDEKREVVIKRSREIQKARAAHARFLP